MNVPTKKLKQLSILFNTIDFDSMNCDRIKETLYKISLEIGDSDFLDLTNDFTPQELMKYVIKLKEILNNIDFNQEKTMDILDIVFKEEK